MRKTLIIIWIFDQALRSLKSQNSTVFAQKLFFVLNIFVENTCDIWIVDQGGHSLKSQNSTSFVKKSFIFTKTPIVTHFFLT